MQIRRVAGMINFDQSKNRTLDINVFLYVDNTLIKNTSLKKLQSFSHPKYTLNIYSSWLNKVLHSGCYRYSVCLIDVNIKEKKLDRILKYVSICQLYTRLPMVLLNSNRESICLKINQEDFYVTGNSFQDMLEGDNKIAEFVCSTATDTVIVA